MKKIKTTQEIFMSQLDNCEYYDDDCLCFGLDIENRFYLYTQDFDSYNLYIFDDTFHNLMTDNDFVSKLAIHEIEHNKDTFLDFCGFVSDCMNGCYDMDKRPFELHDIAYSFPD